MPWVGGHIYTFAMAKFLPRTWDRLSSSRSWTLWHFYVAMDHWAHIYCTKFSEPSWTTNRTKSKDGALLFRLANPTPAALLLFPCQMLLDCLYILFYCRVFTLGESNGRSAPISLCFWLCLSWLSGRKPDSSFLRFQTITVSVHDRCEELKVYETFFWLRLRWLPKETN